ncbi:zinc finger domain-containing protein, partial [Modestobacter versicolor]|uniref:zinc finger domain-containing protein n=1 Tax=Modestobacter versicolor TaxID=429133 RepID=UPI0028155F6A
SPGTCPTCHGNGARPGTSPHTCPVCNGAGVTSRSQGAFAFSDGRAGSPPAPAQEKPTTSCGV